MSTNMSPCRAEVCLLIWETSGGMAARKALTGTSDIDVLDRGRGSQRRRHEKSATRLGRTLVRKGIWPFLEPWNALKMRATTSSWNVPSTFRPCGELFSFIVKEPTIREDTGEDGRSSADEEGEHKVEKPSCCARLRITRAAHFMLYLCQD